jgi:hypothetical protein
VIVMVNKQSWSGEVERSWRFVGAIGPGPVTKRL